MDDDAALAWPLFGNVIDGTEKRISILAKCNAPKPRRVTLDTTDPEVTAEVPGEWETEPGEHRT
ncbi:MAG: hypothetical protein QM747_19315 [Nocardioides sp.]